MWFKLLSPFPQVYKYNVVNVLLFDMYKEWNWEIHILYLVSCSARSWLSSLSALNALSWLSGLIYPK